MLFTPVFTAGGFCDADTSSQLEMIGRGVKCSCVHLIESQEERRVANRTKWKTPCFILCMMKRQKRLLYDCLHFYPYTTCIFYNTHAVQQNKTTGTPTVKTIDLAATFTHQLTQRFTERLADKVWNKHADYSCLV